MKGFHKIAATLAALPVAGVIALTGAGIASAATCPAGQHWNEMGGGSGFCSPDASGGGTGGNGSVDLGGTNTPAPQAPVFNQPAPYKPPVYGPAPAPVQQAPVRQAPAPVQNYVPVAPVERSVPAPAEVHGSTGNEVKSLAPGTAVSEPKKEAADVHKEVAADKAPEKVEVKKDADKITKVKDAASSAATAPTDSATPTTSASPTPVMTIDASRSSETQKVTALSTFIVAFAMLAGFASFLIIRNFRKSQTCTD